MNKLIEDTDILRDLMLRNKTYLARLYQSKNPAIAKKLLVNSSDKELNLLLQIVHYISEGKIHVTKKCFHQGQIKKRSHFIEKSFGTKEKVNDLLNSSREVQCKHLTRLANCFPDLLYLLFNEKE